MKSKKTFKSYADAVKHAKENKRKFIEKRTSGQDKPEKKDPDKK